MSEKQTNTNDYSAILSITANGGEMASIEAIIKDGAQESMFTGKIPRSMIDIIVPTLSRAALGEAGPIVVQTRDYVDAVVEPTPVEAGLVTALAKRPPMTAREMGRLGHQRRMERRAKGLPPLVTHPDESLDLIRTVAAGLAAGAFHFTSLRGDVPGALYERYGWEKSFDQNGRIIVAPKGECLGWVGNGSFYVHTRSAYEKINQYRTGVHGRKFSCGADTMRMYLRRRLSRNYADRIPTHATVTLPDTGIHKSVSVWPIPEDVIFSAAKAKG